MKIYILGIGGTFMAGLAALAKAQGHTVGGMDKPLYPPMSLQLENLGIAYDVGYSAASVSAIAAFAPDQVIIGNALSRGNPAVEFVLAEGFPYVSGAQWLYEAVLRQRQVLAVAGTHGKTTTTSLLAFILREAGRAPGYLIGGVAKDFPESAALGAGQDFVIEADEYDTAFFDKRPKFLHYRPKIAILNNLEFDHADIYADLAAIERQFHYLLRAIPPTGLVLVPKADMALQRVLAQGIWTPYQTFGAVGSTADWQGEAQGTRWQLWHREALIAEADFPLLGQHNVLNATAAVAAAAAAGVDPKAAVAHLARFAGVKRRLEKRFANEKLVIFEDFAHHPTAIAATLAAVAAHYPHHQHWLALDLRSNTMRLGSHKAELAEACAQAARVWVQVPSDVTWPVAEFLAAGKFQLFHSTETLAAALESDLAKADFAAPVALLLCSNGDFGGLPARLPSYASALFGLG
jgi:UDP-N-acetylmuramate: L-alanyl-gamma-D-glutamyl-meso-diaminopimelate ligase